MRALILMIISIFCVGYLNAQNTEDEDSFIPQNDPSIYMHKSHEISMGGGVSAITTGDFTGMYSKVNYNYWINDYFYAAFEFANALASGHHRMGPPGDYPYVYVGIDHNNPINNQKGFQSLDNGFKHFPTNHERSIYYMFNAKAGLAYNLGNHVISIGSGPSITYGDVSYWGMKYPVTVKEGINMPEDTKVSLVVPVYHRFLDYGIASHLQYRYIISSLVAANFNVGANFYLQSTGIFSASVGISFKFDG